MQKTVTVKYKAGYSGEYTYSKCNVTHCPSCGKKEVWYELGCPDYYTGEEHLCTSCDSVFYLPICDKVDTDRQKQVLRQLKEDM